MRFDLQDGHDLMPRIEEIVPKSAGGSEELDNLCLTHVRCNARQVRYGRGQGAGANQERSDFRQSRKRRTA